MKPDWNLNGIRFFRKNRYTMCLNLIFDAFPRDEFSVNIPEQVFAADGRKGGFMDFQPDWRASEGGLGFRWEQPKMAAISVQLDPSPLALRFAITVRNLEGKPWQNVCAFPCFNQLDAPTFEDCAMERTFIPLRSGLARLAEVPRVPSASGRPFQIFILEGADNHVLPGMGCTSPTRASSGHIITQSRDGRWSVGMACGSPAFLFNNQEISCIHACPTFGHMLPGDERTRSGEIRFHQGTPASLARLFEETFPS